HSEVHGSLLCALYVSFLLPALRDPPISTLFPYTTLFRSQLVVVPQVAGLGGAQRGVGRRIEPQQRRGAAQLGQADASAAGEGQIEIGGGVADGELDGRGGHGSPQGRAWGHGA